MKKILKIVLCVLLALVVLAGGYFAYVMLSYHRIGDQTLAVRSETDTKIAADTDYTLVSWNIGFGAYEPEWL